VAATESDFDLAFAALAKRNVRYWVVDLKRRADRPKDREDIERLTALVEGGNRG
jgi:hypothetical protein